jgi:hypothetical protein
MSSSEESKLLEAADYAESVLNNVEKVEIS